MGGSWAILSGTCFKFFHNQISFKKRKNITKNGMGNWFEPWG